MLIKNSNNMLLKVSHVFEYLYLVVTALSIYKLATEWNSLETSRIILFVIFAVAGVIMFFFKRHFRKKMQQNDKA